MCIRITWKAYKTKKTFGFSSISDSVGLEEGKSFSLANQCWYCQFWDHTLSSPTLIHPFSHTLLAKPISLKHSSIYVSDVHRISVYLHSLTNKILFILTERLSSVFLAPPAFLPYLLFLLFNMLGCIVSYTYKRCGIRYPWVWILSPPFKEWEFGEIFHSWKVPCYFLLQGPHIYYSFSHRHLLWKTFPVISSGSTLHFFVTNNTTCVCSCFMFIFPISPRIKNTYLFCSHHISQCLG